MLKLFEKDIEKYLVSLVRNLGGLAWKFNSGIRGVPDRIILLPGGRVIFVELKAPGQKPRPLQTKRIKELRELGFQVKVIDSKNQVDDWLTIERLNGVRA